MVMVYVDESKVPSTLQGKDPGTRRDALGIS